MTRAKLLTEVVDVRAEPHGKAGLDDWIGNANVSSIDVGENLEGRSPPHYSFLGFPPMTPPLVACRMF
jgi:hypothetical protein